MNKPNTEQNNVPKVPAKKPVKGFCPTEEDLETVNRMMNYVKMMRPDKFPDKNTPK